MLGKGVLFVSAICEHVLYRTMGFNTDKSGQIHVYIYKDLFYVLNNN